MELPVIWRLLKFVVTLNKNAAVVKYFKKPSSIYCASQKSDFLIVEEWPPGPTNRGPGGLFQKNKKSAFEKRSIYYSFTKIICSSTSYFSVLCYNCQNEFSGLRANKI